MHKKKLRHRVTSELSQLTAEQIGIKSKLACKNVLESEHFQNASVVMLFLSMPTEVDTSHIIHHAWQQNKIVVVPKVMKRKSHMIAVEISSLDVDDLAHEKGLRHPAIEKEIAIEDIDLVLTPGLAFDNKGNRLGRGGGYYDSFFNLKRFRAHKCGLIFANQIVESVPTEHYDEPVDFFVTDHGIVHCN